MTAFNEISPVKLMRLIGTAQCPAIVDVCIDDDFADDPLLVPTAFRHSHKDVDGLITIIGTRGNSRQRFEVVLPIEDILGSEYANAVEGELVVEIRTGF